MNLWNQLASRLAALFRKRTLDADMDDEVRTHIEMRTQANIEAGMNPEEARFAALRQFGWTESIRETCREQRGVRWLENLALDIRFGARQLRKNPGFTLVAVLTLALGIGANTAIFTLINSVLLRSLPVRNPGELVQIVSRGESGRPDYDFSYPFYERLRDGGRSLSGLFATGGVGLKDRLAVPSEGNAANEFVRAQPVSGNFFLVLGVPAMLGGRVTPEDDAPDDPQAAVVISHNFWQRRFGGDRSVVGKAVRFYDLLFTIVGVTPPGFFGFQPGENPDLWWPLHMAPQTHPDPSGGWLKPGINWLRLVGRLSSGIERGEAEAELGVIFKRYQDEFAASRAAKWSDEVRKRYFAQRFELRSARAGWTNLHDQFRQPLMILMAAVALVLLVACANIASLLLARAAARQREFSMRSALGAGRLRLIRQVLTESLLLGSFGAGLGLLLAQAGMRLLQTVLRLPVESISLNLAPDGRVLVFTIAVAILASLFFGLAPVWQIRRFDLATALKGTTGSVSSSAERQRGFQALVIAQMSLSLILLAGAGLFVRTLQNLRGLDAGFNRENLVLFNTDFTETPDAARLSLFQEELLAGLDSLPGVHSASLVNFGFLSDNYWTANLLAEGYEAQPGEDIQCSGSYVGPRFFETFGVPILSGRAFGPADELPAGTTNAMPQSAVVNQALVRRYFGDVNPLGRRVYFAHRPEMKLEIVGVVSNAKYRSLRIAAPPTIYLPFLRADAGATFALRTSGDVQVTTASLAALARELNQTVRVRDVRTMTDVVNGSVQQERFVAQLGGFFSVLALALACLGLYGVLSFVVVQRTREIGVRVALGARRRDVLSLVVGKGLRLTLAGCALGLVGGLSMTRFVSSLLYGVTPADPVTFAGVVFLLLGVAALASWLPARRAARVNPMEALRCE